MDLFKLYKNNEFDLSAFGIQRGERRSDYFCTPRGAEIIGWTGVDGIHYCTVKGLGKTVFAVSPMSLPGEYVFPVAESFDDFLRLLMACGDEAYVEQAHAWTKERYNEFSANNPSSPEAKAQTEQLKSKYSITAIEDPFEYLKSIYQGFDPAVIPYKSEYFDIVDLPEPKKKQPFSVYFSLTNGVGGERAGEKKDINRHFSWGGSEWFIPAAYICAKGIVLDIFMEADGEKTYGFLFRQAYGSADEQESRQVGFERSEPSAEDNPLAFDFDATLAINGRSVKNRQGQGNCWVKDTELYASEEMKELIDHYGIDDEKCIVWRRMCFPWATKSKPDIKTLTLELSQRPHAALGDRFSVERTPQEIHFTHPITKTPHILTVTEYALDKLSKHARFSDGYEYPAFCAKMAYSVSPYISPIGFTVSDTRRSDPPRRSPEAKAQSYDFVSTALKIIGGADGPETVAIAAPSEQRVGYACSALTFEPQKTVNWQMLFREKTVKDAVIPLI